MTIAWNGSVWDGGIPCHPLEAVKAVYVEVPKAGCTSVKTALAHFKGGHAEGDIHRWFGYTIARDVDELYAWFETRWRSFFRFTVVREPVARFESFYYGLTGACPEDISRFALEDFSWCGWRTDIHVARQTRIVGTELDRFSFVGHTEEMVRVQEVLIGVLGPLSIPRLNATEAPRGTLTPAARSHLRQIYREDLRVLGYR